jgi:hypothetical protein
MRRTNGRKTKAAPVNENYHVHTDVYHNHERPCCRLLSQVATEIFPQTNISSSTSTSSKEEEANSHARSADTDTAFLAAAIRHHLLHQQQRQQQTTVPSSTTATAFKKKRKKKRKKKGTAALEESSTQPVVEDLLPEEEIIAPAGATASGSGSGSSEASLPTTADTADRSGSSESLFVLESPEAASAASESLSLAAAAATEPPLQSHQQQQPNLSALDMYLNRLLLKRQKQQQQHPSAATAGTDSSNNSDSDILTNVWSVLESKLVAGTAQENVFHIPHESVVAAVNAIHCRACKDQVKEVVDIQSKIPLHQQEDKHTARRSHVTASLAPVDDEHAFDYIAMEEGDAGVAPTTTTKKETQLLAFELVSAQGRTAGWVLRRADGSAALQSLAELEALVKEYILTPGLSPDQIMGCDQAQDLSENVTDSIQVSVDSRCQQQMVEFHRMTQEMHAQVQKFAATKDHASSNIEMKSFPIMKEVDEACCAVLAKMLRIVLQVTTVYQGIATTLGEGNWAFRGVMDVWKSYLGAIDVINTETVHFEEQLFQMANRGSIPGMFLSSTARILYRQLVGVKIKAVVDTIQAVQGRLDRQEAVECVGGENWTAFFSRKLFTLEMFCKATGTAECSRHHKKLPIDHACEDVLYTVREWTETIHQMTASKILECHEQRRQKLVRLVRTLTETAKTTPGSAEISIENLSRLEGQLMLSQQVADAEENGDLFKTLRMHLGSSTLKMIEVWMSFRPLANTGGGDYTVHGALPYKLQGWMASEPGFRKSDVDTHHCTAGDGAPRAVSILVGLFYRWMSDRCKEWQAQVAEQELLVAMEGDDDKAAEASAVGKGAKTGKKNKKKKDKKDRPVEAQALVRNGKAKENVGIAAESILTPPVNVENKASHTLEIKSSNGVDPTPANFLEEREAPLSESPGDADNVQKNEQKKPIPAAPPAGSTPSKEKEVVKGKAQKSNVRESGVSKSDSGKAPVPLAAKPTNEADEGTRKKIDKAQDGKKVNGRKEKTKKAKAASSPKSAGNQSNTVHYVDADVTIGVYHKSSFESAEDFLVGRLLAILNSGRSNKAI